MNTCLPIVDSRTKKEGNPHRAPERALGLWARKLETADSTVVQRTLLTLNENPKGLPGVNESPEHVEKRESSWASMNPAHFDVKLGIKSMLGLLRIVVFWLIFRILARFSFGRWLLLKFPSFFKSRVASFKMVFVGKGYSEGELASKGKKPDVEVIRRVTGPETGYVTTPIILLQSALVLLKDREDLPKGGVYTPGIVFGPTDLQERLQENGISFEFISKKAL